MTEHPPTTQGDIPPSSDEKMTGLQSYNTAVDMTTGISLRGRDYKLQLIALIIGLIVGAGAGLIIARGALIGAGIGAVLGIVAGVFLTGAYLAFANTINHLRGKHD